MATGDGAWQRPKPRLVAAEMTAAELDEAFKAAMGPPKMTEAQLQAGVLGECQRLGLRVHHNYRSDRAGIREGGRGFPDLVIAGEHGVLFRELKTEDGRTSTDQDWWAWYLDHAGHDFAIWRPADLSSGRISTELRSIS